jgi:hypothetical protein
VWCVRSYPEGHRRVSQGWLLGLSTSKDKNKRRGDNPQQAGASGCVGDIARENWRYITGLEIDELCADFAIDGGAAPEDDANALRYKAGREAF